MAKKQKQRREAATPTVFEQARDEMFYHVIHCGVAESDPGHHDEWFDETMHYLAERYPELEAGQLAELRTVGERFAQPAKAAQGSEAVAASA